jgi:hypothetical protein
MITTGIRELVKRVVPEASFTPINMQAHDLSWSAAATCDRIIICGNPRFTMSTGNEFWENGMWDLLLDLQRDGRRVIDGWAGSAFPYNEYAPTSAEMAKAIAAFPGRQKRLEQAAQLHGRITRDSTMQLLYENAGAPATLLPCSSWWARDAYGTEGTQAFYDAIVVYQLRGHEWMPEALARVQFLMTQDLPVKIIATTWPDYLWAQEHGFDVELFADVESLLEFFAFSRRVLSFRLHAAIPAASLGCEVAAVSIDSRTDACLPFGIPVVRFTELSQWTPTFATATKPDTAFACETLRAMLL